MRVAHALSGDALGRFELDQGVWPVAALLVVLAAPAAQALVSLAGGRSGKASVVQHA